MRLGGPEVDIENNNSDADAEGVKDHGEEHKLAEEGDNQGGGGDDLGEEEEEHGEGEEDGDGEGDLQGRESLDLSRNLFTLFL